MDLGFRDKVVIVTGGGSNIGRAIAHEFGREGAIVAILDRDLQQAQKTAGESAVAGRASV